MKLPCPIPYQGSKRKIAADILCYFPDNVKRLVEPFAGSAAVTVAAAIRRKATRFWINDVNEPLMRLWREIVYHPDRIAKKYSSLWHEQLGNRREFYDQVRDDFNRSGGPDTLLYLLSRCVKASVRYNKEGEFNQSPDNRRKGMHPETKATHIHRVSNLLRHKMKITALDYREVFDDVEKTDLVYMDPPYQGVLTGDPRYAEGVSFQGFVESLDMLTNRSIRFLVSYDGKTGERTHGKGLPEELGLTRIAIEAGTSTQATLLGRDEVTTESLYVSPALLEEIHIQTYSQTGLFKEGA